MWAKVLNAKTVYLFDPDSRRIDFAKSLDFLQYDGLPVDIVIEASGVSVALNDAIKNVKPLGEIVLVGHSKKDTVIPHEKFALILRKQLKLIGSWNSDFTSTVNDWKDSISAIKKVLFSPKNLSRTPYR